MPLGGRNPGDSPFAQIFSLGKELRLKMEQFGGSDQGHRDDEVYRRRILEKLNEMGAPPPDALRDELANELVRRYRAAREAEE